MTDSTFQVQHLQNHPGFAWPIIVHVHETALATLNKVSATTGSPEPQEVIRKLTSSWISAVLCYPRMSRGLWMSYGG